MRRNVFLDGCASRRVLSSFVLALAICQPLAAQTDDPPAAVNLHATASNLYQAQDFGLAAEQWETLLEDYPDFSMRQEAELFLGMSYYKSQAYEKAAARFQSLKDSLRSISEFKHGDSLVFFLAYCQYALGLADESDTDQTRLKEAGNNFRLFFEEFPNSSLADQAWYFHGETQYRLGQLDRAAQSYQQLIDRYPDSDFHGEALYALGVCLEEKGDFVDAIGVYQQILDADPESNRALEIQFRRADCRMQTALALENAGNADTAAEQFTLAESEFAELADTEGFATDEALYHQAFCRLHLQQMKPAADLYARLATEFPQSRYAERSALAAGKYYFSAQDMDDARNWLERVVGEDNEHQYEAAHWLSRIQFEDGQYLDAYETANRALADDAKHPFRINLLMDCADALYEIPERKKDSIPIYLQVVSEFPSDRLAPTALYYAAFACLETDQLDAAMKLAERFAADYDDHSFLPDALQIQGEACLRQEQYETAQQVFQTLAARFEGNENINYWNTRIGWARYLQKQYDETISWLAPLVSEMDNDVNRSEAHYLIGSSHFQLQDFPKALQALQECLRANRDRSNAHEVRLLTARCHYQLGDSDEALELARQGLDELPDELADQTYYWLGEFAYQSSEFDEAAEHYAKVINSGRQSTFLPNCLYGRSWSLLKSDQLDEAIESFTTLIEDHAEHELVSDALIGRGMTYRLAGHFDRAADDLQRFLDGGPEGEKRFNAAYELGLAYVGLKDWDKAIEVLSPLAEADGQPEESDNILYELAWAHRTKGEEDAANRLFARIAEDHSDSPFAAEAHFHIAQDLYEQEKYAAAAERYRQCLKTSRDDAITEKAAFKLGWSHFQLEQYDQALAAFEEQVDRFPESSLSADGLFMVSESHHRMDNHRDAVTAYRVAIDAVNASDSVRPEIKMLAPIHAAQSANEAKEYQLALGFAKPLVDENPGSPFAPEAWYEIGLAHKGLGDGDEAVAAWEKAMVSLSKTGARARCMIGEEYFERKEYEDAIKQFKLVVNGYGGLQAPEEIQPWQAFAAYEAARCNYVQIRDAQDPQQKARLVEEATKMFQYVVTHYPENRLADDAQKQLENLNRVR